MSKETTHFQLMMSLSGFKLMIVGFRSKRPTSVLTCTISTEPGKTVEEFITFHLEVSVSFSLVIGPDYIFEAAVLVATLN